MFGRKRSARKIGDKGKRSDLAGPRDTPLTITKEVAHVAGEKLSGLKQAQELLASSFILKGKISLFDGRPHVFR